MTYFGTVCSEDCDLGMFNDSNYQVLLTASMVLVAVALPSRALGHVGACHIRLQNLYLVCRLQRPVLRRIDLPQL